MHLLCDIYTFNLRYLAEYSFNNFSCILGELRLQVLLFSGAFQLKYTKHQDTSLYI